MFLQQSRESFSSHRFITEPKTGDFEGGRKRPDGSRKLFKGKQKRNTILSRLPAMVVPYRKEIKALENLRMNLSIQLAYR